MERVPNIGERVGRKGTRLCGSKGCTCKHGCGIEHQEIKDAFVVYGKELFAHPGQLSALSSSLLEFMSLSARN